MSVTHETGAPGTVESEHLGPVDVVVIAYPPDAPMTGEAAPLLIELVERGIIRVFDAMFVTKGTDGSVVGFEAKDLDERGVGGFKLFEGASSGLLGDDDIAAAAEVLDPGMSAAVIVYENRWAVPFIDAVHRNGGVVIDSQRIPAQDLIDIVDAMEASS
jgi:hypothetical protein